MTTGYGIVKISVTPSFAGKTLADLDFGPHGKWEVVVLLLQRKQDVIISPRSTEVINPTDFLVVAGRWDKLEDLFAKAQKSG
ncbi:MAG: TrkA C-terminal domain-containing protein [Dehalococcoidales bacterium]|nr:TrkA C-terminal domain-containing protein [Dehalococcoidales bacterium]